MVIWPEFRMGQCRDDDHQAESPLFNNVFIGKIPWFLFDLFFHILSLYQEDSIWEGNVSISWPSLKFKSSIENWKEDVIPNTLQIQIPCGLHSLLSYSDVCYSVIMCNLYYNYVIEVLNDQYICQW